MNHEHDKLDRMAQHLDSALITQWARRAATGLANEQEKINSLNVFPIPDSDTGTNMAATMAAAVEALDELVDPEVVDITAALALGAVRGARGNSGLILSQFLRALAQAATQGPIDGEALGTTLRQASEFAREAITSPVEGTIITVLAAAATGAEGEESDSLDNAVASALSAAETALQETTHQLEALAQAGVVDAGGYGFVLLLTILRDVLAGAPAPEDNPSAAAEVTQEVEVMFSFALTAGSSRQTFDELKTYMEQHGNSVVAGIVSATEMTMHVHTAQAGPIIEKAYALGAVSNLRIEVLPEHNTEEDIPTPTLPIIAMCPQAQGQSGVQELFQQLGAHAVVSGSSGTQALDHANGPTLVLVNGQDVNALRGSVSHRNTTHSPLEFIDTGSVVGGLAALAVFDPTAEWEDTIDDVLSAISSQRSMDIEPPIDGEGLGHKVNEMLDTGGELLTVLWDDAAGEGHVSSSVDSALHVIKQEHPEVEVQTIHTTGLGMPVQIGVE